MDKITYVGSCQHDIDEDWYNSDESSYLVLDESSGACVTVTTCMDCKDDNIASGRIVDPDDIPMDDFVNPFADDPLTGSITVVNTDGTTTVHNLDESDVSVEELDGFYTKDLTH